MNTELDERIRQALSDVFDATPELGPTPSELFRSRMPEGSARRSSALIAAAAVVVIGVGGLLLLTRPSDVAEPGTSTAATTVQPGGAVGQFVWPAPSRDLASLDDLIEAFASEVLSWSPLDVRRDGETTTELGPQSFTLVNTGLDREVSLLAIPSPEGWGFVQIGDPLSATVTDQATTAVQFQRPPGTATSSIEARFAVGTTVADTTTGAAFELPDGRQIDTLVSVLVVHVDDDGNVIGATGGQFGTVDAQTPSTVSGTPSS